MKVLIACEFSGTVRDAFIKKGHDAISCDLMPGEGEFINKHYQGDLFDLELDSFDLVIAHPPCTYLTVTGNKWFKDQPKRKSGALVGQERRDARVESIKFFMDIMNCGAYKIAIENPIGVMSSEYRKPDQVVHPYMFGHEASKATCLWLKNLPLLVPTNIVEKGESYTYKSGKRMQKWYADAAKLKPKEREKLRNTTFQGIAYAMADQWS